MAEQQHGVFSRDQAMANGHTPRTIDVRTATGRWIGVHPGVYRIGGARKSWRQSVMAACLSAGGSARASHLSAAVLSQIVDRHAAPIEITVAYRCRPIGSGFTVHRSRVDDQIQVIDAIPVASVPRILVDLVGSVGPRITEEALDVALRRHLVTIEQMVSYLSGLTGKRGLGKLRGLVGEREGRQRHAVGTFATRVNRILIDAGLPMPELEYEVRRDGHLLGKVDVCYPDQRVFIELNSWEFHSSRQAFDHDHVRQNLIVEQGYVPLGFTWTDLDKPRYVAGMVRSVLRTRGHPAL